MGDFFNKMKTDVFASAAGDVAGNVLGAVTGGDKKEGEGDGVAGTLVNAITGGGGDGVAGTLVNAITGGGGDGVVDNVLGAITGGDKKEGEGEGGLDVPKLLKGFI
ncbi:uncharacterized protein LOC127537408 isoform X3 [Acanthochromis polyacanthus]|uniref:uncharacterized protein LOC127537408 isoform X3 n=1 Tax=Acanthochromis polyacanthus TaxID=80966 RepID=UPI00223424E0|nr:uncharacterized protein LOC127537408 isoform X3 [Acanthochromis polyacanthus]